MSLEWVNGQRCGTNQSKRSSCRATKVTTMGGDVFLDKVIAI